MRKVALLGLSLVGLWDSTYLWWAYTSPSRPMVCVGAGCDAVRASPFAYPWGIPLPMFGVAMYAALALLILAEALVETGLARACRRAVAWISGAGFLFSLYLTGIETFVLRTWCTWCVVSAVVVTLIFALAVLDVFRPLPHPEPAAAIGLLRKYFVVGVGVLVVGTPAFLLLALHETPPPPQPISTSLLSERLVRPDSHTTGNPKAPLTVVEFGDFECSACGPAEVEAQEARRKYGDRIRFVFRHFPLESIHPHAMKAAEASECAAAQGKFWEAVEKLYRGQADLREAALTRYASELGLDAERFRHCLASGEMAARVRRDLEDARALGLRATPTFFVGSQMIEGPLHIDEFARLIGEEYGQQGPMMARTSGAAASAPATPKPGATKPAPAATGADSTPSSGGLLGTGGLFNPFQSSATTCSEEEALKQQATLVRTDEAREFFESQPQALFVDVRKADEFKAGRIPGAINIPVEQIEGNAERLPKDRVIVLYESGRTPGDVCAASRAAGRALLARGFAIEKIMVYQDGLAGWEKAGLPVEH